MATRREFMQKGAAASAGVLLPMAKLRPSLGAAGQAAGDVRPNILLILADDLGFSDIGCYGSEIDTPNLDALAKNGLQFTDFHNSPRCCPSRASLMTGMYAQQAGMGLMAYDYGRYPYPGYRGDLSGNCVTIAEGLKNAGYQTYIVGKWNLTPLTVGNHNYPLQRGFDHYYGIIDGATSYYDPDTLTRDNNPIEVDPQDHDFYLTDAFGDNAVQYIEQAALQKKPFFLYAAFTASHWPLMAPEETIAKYKGRYSDGWDALRAVRHAKQVAHGVVPAKWNLTKRDPRVPAWEDASYHEWEARRMEVYAAQIDKMDHNIGKMVSKLRELNMLDDTLIFFLADNGGNYEEIAAMTAAQARPSFIPYRTKTGEAVVPGNNPEIMPGPASTYQSYGIPWGNVSNTPFRMYKHYAHEGGISTPFIVHWPKGIQKRGLVSAIGHEIDIMPTCLDVAHAVYPAVSKAGAPLPPFEGESLTPLFNDGAIKDRSLFWEHEGNCAVREGRWKLVSRYPDSWELYDMEEDRTETNDLADAHPTIVRKMAADYHAWKVRVGAQSWPMPETPEEDRTSGMFSPPYLLHDRP